MKKKFYLGGVINSEALNTLDECFRSAAEEYLVVRKLEQKRMKQYCHPPTSWLICKSKARSSENHRQRMIRRRMKYKIHEEK